MGRLIGYARVSTVEQDLQLQIEALQHAGCRDDQIFRDVASGARTARSGLEACLQALAPGDTLVVWRLDRLGRSMVHLVTVIEELLRRQVGFRSLCDGAIDTTTASGEFVFHLFSALAQFERRLIQERTRTGLAAARARGKHGGRRPLRPEDPRVRMASMMYGHMCLLKPPSGSVGDGYGFSPAQWAGASNPVIDPTLTGDGASWGPYQHA